MKLLLAAGALLLLFAVATSPAGAQAQAVASQPESIQQLDADAARAKDEVIAIVNQPIEHLPRTSQAAVSSPGWFHPGAIKPDFNTVDIRATQQLIYENDSYVTSDLNPNEMFLGRQLEFNAMTKYFYVDRTLPKARLSEAQMLEVNRLYRIIGRDEQAHAERGQQLALLSLLAVVLIAALVLIRRLL